MKKIQIEISWNIFWQILTFIGVILIFYLARTAWGVLFSAIIISLGLDPMVSFFERRGVNRILGTLLVFLLGFLTLSASIYFIVPVLVKEASGFLDQFNRIITTILGIGLPQTAIQTASTNLNQILGLFGSTASSITSTISAIFSKIVFAIFIIVISFYLSVEKNGTERMLRIILPKIYEQPVIKIFHRFKIKIRLWLVAQLGLSLAVGSLVTLGLWLLGVKYAIVLGLIAALFELVPVIGPILSGLIAFLVAINTSFSLGMYVIALFFIVQQLENHILIPLLMKKSMNVHPVVVLIALLAGGEVAGLTGAVLAVPIAILIQEIFNYLAESKEKMDKSKLNI